MLRYFLRALTLIFFIAGLAVSATLGWFFYATALRPSFERKWIQIPSPTEPLTTLKADDTGEIFAEGVDDGLYQLSIYPEPAWMEISGADRIYSGLNCTPIAGNEYKSKPMPQKVKAHISVDCSFAEQALYLDIDLLENGETWYFETSNNSYVVFGLIVLLPIGLVVNVVIYLLALLFFALDLIITLRQKANLKQAA